MSSASVRTMHVLGRAIRGIVWTVLLFVLAASGAGLVGEAFHAPGGTARAELTYTGDSALGARLDTAEGQLRAIAADVDRLATEAKTALEEIASSDPTRLDEAIDRGAAAASRIEAGTRTLRVSLADLPGDEPDAAMLYANATLVRRSAILVAAEAAASVAAQWRQVATRATDAAALIALIDRHDTTVLQAAEHGSKARYARAIPILDEALVAISDVQAMRVRLIPSPDPTILDEWIQRCGAFDVALKALYQALRRSNNNPNTPEVQSARRAEREAWAQLPPDRRTIVVIVGEVARGGLTEAVLAIEDASFRIDEALDDAEVEASPGTA